MTYLGGYLGLGSALPATVSTITLAIVSPTEGSVVGRTVPLIFTVTGTEIFRRVIVTARYGGSTVEETIHDGITFSPSYTGGVNARGNVTIGLEDGYQFTILRLGGWRGSSVVIKIIAIDAIGNLGLKTLGEPLAEYTWQIAGGGSADNTPFVGSGSAG